MANPMGTSVQERTRSGLERNLFMQEYLKDRDITAPTAIERYVSPFQMAGEAGSVSKYLYQDQKVFSAVAMIAISFLALPLFNRIILMPTQEGMFGLLPLVILYTLSWMARLRHVVFDAVIAASWVIISFLAYPVINNLLAIGYFTTLGPMSSWTQWITALLFSLITPALGGLYLFCVWISFKLIGSAILMQESKERS